MGSEWITAGSGALDVYVRAVAFGGVAFLALARLSDRRRSGSSSAAGRAGQIRVWSLAYLSFWIVKTLCATNPLVLFAGSPLYVDLPAGTRREHRSARRDPFAPRPGLHDLLTIGERRGHPQGLLLQLLPRRVSGAIETGPVAIGARRIRRRGDCSRHRDVARRRRTARALLVTTYGRGGSPRRAPRGIDRRAEDRRRLPWLSRHLPASARADRRLHGRAARRRATRVLAARRTASRRSCSRRSRRSTTLLRDRRPSSRAGRSTSRARGLGSSSSGRSRSASQLALTIPRVLNLALEPDRAYPLYGWRWAAHRAITRLTNIRLFPRLLGDSSYIVHYLRWLGYDLYRGGANGSNFGLEVKHETPFHATVGTGTMVADGLSIVNAEIYEQLLPSLSGEIGGAQLPRATTSPTRRGVAMGDNCLLATKVAVPIDGRGPRGHRACSARPASRSALGRARRQIRPPKARPGAGRRLRRKNRHNAGDDRPLPAVAAGLRARDPPAHPRRRRASRALRTRRRSRWAALADRVHGRLLRRSSSGDNDGGASS